MSTEQNGSEAGTPSPARLCSNFEQLRLRNEIVAHIMRAGGTAEDCAVALAAHNDKLVERLMTLEGIAPRRIKLPFGRVMIWHYPDRLIPETDMSNAIVTGSPVGESGGRSS